VTLSNAAPASVASGEAPRRRKWTGDDLIQMGEVGLLPPEGRFELLGGEVYDLMPPGPLHASIVDLIRALLVPLALAHGGHARQQNPIRLNEEYDPQPDIAIVGGREHAYRDRFPGPEDVLLVVEVSDASLQYDRDLKLRAYAGAGVPECWIVNLPEQQIEVYRDPAGDEYLLRHIRRSGETVEALAAPGVALAVAELLGGEAQPEAK